MKSPSSGICEMCGHHVGVRQKAHIVAEQSKSGANLLLLCPTCHIMFDTHVKPKMFKALSKAGVKGIPKSWESSIYDQAAKASQAAKQKKNSFVRNIYLKTLSQHIAIICCILLFYVLLLPTILLKEVTTMTTAVRITDDLVRDAKIFSKIDKRSITGQIEHWACIGKCAEENPDLTYSLIKDILIGIAELEQGESSEYKFG